MSNLDFTITPAASDYPTVASMAIIAQRHLTFDPASLGAIDAVEIISDIGAGKLRLLKNDKIMVDMDKVGQITGSTAFTIRVTQGTETTDCVVDVTIAASLQDQGWADIQSFLHPLNPITGKWDILPGEGFTEWYVATDGDSVADIALAAGVGEGAVNEAFLLANHPTYGGSSGTAIDADVAAIIDNTNGIYHRRYLLKRGQDFLTAGMSEDFGRSGVSMMYPSVVGSYGSGARPIFPYDKKNSQDYSFLLLEELGFTEFGKYVGAGPALAFNKCSSTGINGGLAYEKGCPWLTILNCKITDAGTEIPSNAGTDWAESFSDRHQGMYVDKSDFALIAYNFVDHCAWTENYQADYAWDSGTYGQPPSQFSHNMYLQKTSSGMILYGNISSRSASAGCQMRPGGYARENWFFSNAFHFSDKGQDGSSVGTGNYSIHYENAITQNGIHDPIVVGGTGFMGAQDWAMVHNGYQNATPRGITSFRNDPAGVSDVGTYGTYGVRVSFPAEYISFKTVIIGWDEPDGGENTPAMPHNSDDIDFDIFKDYTIQKYQDQLLSQSGTTGVSDLTDHLRTLEDYRGMSKAFFDFQAAGLQAAGRSGYASPTPRTVAQVVTFAPDPEGQTSGKWWDMPLDWDTGDYPGFVALDSVDLQGGRMRGWAFEAVSLDDFDLGSGGEFIATCSSFDVAGDWMVGTAGATIGSTATGRLTFAGYSGSNALSIVVNGGLTANLGTTTGATDITVGGQDLTRPDLVVQFWNEGYMLLTTTGESCTISSGKTLEVKGHGIASFDGPSGTATLTLASGSDLLFTPVDGEMGVIRERQSGLFGDVAPALTSVVVITNTTVTIDVTGLASGTYDLIDVDTLTGSPTPTITGGSGSVSYATAGKLILTIA